MATVQGKNLVVRILDGTFKGYADTTTTPATPADGDYYIATEDGDYTNFDVSLTGVLAGDILKYITDAWTNAGVSGGGVIACSTSCTMTLNQAFTEVTCKDADSWVSQIEGQKSWEMTVDALYQEDDIAGAKGFVDLSQLIITGPNIAHVAFEEINNPFATVNDNTWSGMARLSTCSLTGPDNEAATYNATLMGNGPLYFTQRT